MKILAKILYIIPVIGAIVGVWALYSCPAYRGEKAILAIAFTVIPYIVAGSVMKVLGCGCNCGCKHCCSGEKNKAEMEVK